MSRKYVLKQRADRMAATRLKLVEATVELHRTLGPAASSLTAIADLAGVQRHTLYSHFPEPEELFTACRKHFLAANPPPSPDRWRLVADPKARLRGGLTDLYGYYAANADMIGNVLRDSNRLPVGSGFIRLHEAAAAALLEAWPSTSEHLRLAIWLATDFYAWRSLRQAGLRVDEAVAVAVSMLRCAASGT